MVKILNQKGSTVITMPIFIVIAVITLTIIFMTIINFIIPFIQYQKLSNIALKYMFLIENYGYLSELEKDNMIDELVIQGFDRDKIYIEATSTVKDYGEPIFINIHYDYFVKVLKVSEHFKFTYEDKEVNMIVRKNGVSKK